MISRSKEDLEQALSEQLGLISVLCDSYDSGIEDMAKPIATAVRILLHNTDKSSALLEQLGILSSTKFFNSATSRSELQKEGLTRVGSYCGLLAISGNGKYSPYLDDPPPGSTRFTDFDEYWNEIIFIDGEMNEFSRREIILAVANKDGGAHIDPKMDDKYVRLSRENSLGWKTGTEATNLTDLSTPVLPAIRQIGHEVLRTLKKDYPVHKPIIQAFAIGGMGLYISKENEVPTIFAATRRTKKVGRNELCPCGSGVKYKRCCGK